MENYSFNHATPSNEIIANLTELQMREIYDYVNKIHLNEDLMRHAEDIYGLTNQKLVDYIEENSEEIIDLYIYKYYDCNMAENDIWEELINDWVNDHETDEVAKVGEWSISVSLLANGNFDVYICEDRASGLHYNDISLEDIGTHLCDDIQCHAEAIDQ